MPLSIDRYEVERLLGQGAMGKVYLARDPKLGREVAIKVMGGRGADTEQRQRFRLEARAIAALKHPNIVELYDYSGEHAEDLFLVMEYVPGRTLQDLAAERGAMSEPTTLCVAHEICLALSHAHQHNVVHRDLKPENVILHRGRVVLMDFGVVKAVARGVLGAETIQTQTRILGTPGFMAPEQLSGRKISAATDIFALGGLLYFLATGESPFDGATLEQIFKQTERARYADPREYSPTLSEGFCGIVDGCLQARPKDRLESAGKARDLILGVLRAHGVTEVRAELNRYHENPLQHAIEQRERSLDVLVRDLKLAVKDRDEHQVKALVRRMQTIAPLGRRFRDVTGIAWGPKRQPRLMAEQKPRRCLWFVLGLGVGLFTGATVAAVAILERWLPPHVQAAVEQVVRSLRRLLG